MRKYSAGMSRTGAHLRLQLEEFPAVMVCDLRLDVSGLTVLRDFLEITVVHSGEVYIFKINFQVTFSCVGSSSIIITVQLLTPTPLHS